MLYNPQIMNTERKATGNQHIVLERITLNKVFRDDLVNILRNNSSRSDMLMRALWRIEKGISVSTSIFPHDYKDRPEQIEELAGALSGAEITLSRVLNF